MPSSQKRFVRHEDVVWETNCEKLLYPINTTALSQASFLVKKPNKKADEYRHWHNDVG